MEITRWARLDRDEILITVKVNGKEIKEDPDIHSLVTTLDTLRVRRGSN